MSRTLFLLLLCACVPSFAWAGWDGPETPMAPQFGQVRLAGDLLIVQANRVRTVPEMRVKTMTYNVEGNQQQTKEIAYTVYKPVYETIERVLSPGDYRIMTVGGQPVDAATAAVRLQEETTVLVSDTGKRLDAALLAIYQPDTLIVYLRPRPKPSYIPAPASAPPPAPQAARQAPTKSLY